MASPVNIRNAVLVPFPPLVVGGAPVKVTKANGIWTISLDVHDLTTGVPLTTAYATDYVIVWDDVAATFSKVSLATLALGGARLQRSATASPIVVAGNDQIINFNINAGSPTCQLPAASTRAGVPLTFKDVGGHAQAHNLTFSFTGGDTADGLAAPKIATNYGWLEFTPLNDGVNTGYALKGSG